MGSGDIMDLKSFRFGDRHVPRKSLGPRLGTVILFVIGMGITLAPLAREVTALQVPGVLVAHTK